MCSPVHMPIKLGNQAAEQRHGKMFTDILFNLPSLLHSLWAVVFDYVVHSITAWCECVFLYANENCSIGDRNKKHLVEMLSVL